MSVLFNFLEFVEVMHESPSEWTKKFEDLKLLLFNMHTVMNSYRPHQARSLIISQLQQQIARRRELLQLINRYGLCAAAFSQHSPKLSLQITVKLKLLKRY